MFNSIMGTRGTLGILVGGGPAPGINGVIAAATIEAKNAGLNVIGIMDGFEGLEIGNIENVLELEIKDVSRIHFAGGSILRTSRANPTKSETLVKTTIESIRRLGLNYLITIGGDDTLFAAYQISKLLRHDVKIAHVPKTIDNDLPLPQNLPSFGYQTARHVGVQHVQNVMEDSKTTNRWYLVVTMGMKAGHLTLGICKAAGATLAVIGEEFHAEKISITHVCDVIEGAMIKRRAMGRSDGVILLSEGIAAKFPEDELIDNCGASIKYDDYGNIRVSEIELGKIIKNEIESRLARRGEKMTLVETSIGYTLRCAAPIPFDCEYVRDLGYAAVHFLVSPQFQNQHSALICVDAGKLVPIELEQMIDPETGRTKIRYVDVHTDSYAVAQEYMIKLKKEDFAEPEKLLSLAKSAQMTLEAFRHKFEYLVK